jgi:hypothetical protein
MFGAGGHNRHNRRKSRPAARTIVRALTYPRESAELFRNRKADDGLAGPKRKTGD